MCDTPMDAMYALLKIGTPALESLIATLKDPDARVRYMAARALSEMKDPRTIDPLIAALKDPDDGVSLTAAYGLREIKDPRIVEPLLAILMNTNDRRNFQLREELVKLLIRFKDPRAVEALKAVSPLKISAAVEDLIWRSEPGSEDELIEVLNEFDYKDVAEDFVNCGNSKLEEAGRAWAVKHGYVITKRYGSANAKWTKK